MLYGIRKQKITLLFLVLDADENGYIERQDFERAARLLAESHDLAPFTQEHRHLRDTYTSIYESIREMMDTDDNGRIQLTEWIAYFSQVLGNGTHYTEIIAPIARHIFNMLDHNENGKISIKEYRRFARAYRIPDEDIGSIFRKLDQNNSGFVTRDEFSHMMADFFFSDDPHKPGNYIFGEF